MNVIIVNPATCTLQEWHNFDTHADYGPGGPDAQLRDYLQGLSDGTVLVGVSCDEPSKELDAAEATLSALGANVSDVGWRGAFVFSAQKGHPASTLLDKELTETSAIGRQPQIIATFSGTQYDLSQKQLSRLHISTLCPQNAPLMH